MRVSVVVPTYRIGGIDILVSSLQNQTYEDFELIICDCIHKHRKDIIKQEISKLGLKFDVKHVEPINNRYPLNIYCHSVNTAIDCSDGDIILVQTDYTWMHPNCIESHVNLHKKLGHKTAVLTSYKYVEPKSVCTAIKNKYKINCSYSEDPIAYKQYESHNADDYVDNLNRGVYDPYMWSIFEEELTPKTNINDFATTYVDIKSNSQEVNKFVDSGLTPDLCHLKNDSFNINDVLLVNGLDEAMDGNHAYQDTEFSWRLNRGAGTKFYVCIEPTATVINVRDILYMRKYDAITDKLENEFFYTRSKVGNLQEVNTWKLKSR